MINCLNPLLLQNFRMSDTFCRLCAKEKKLGIEIYKEEGLKQKLSTKIFQCLQIRICPNDQLPKMVCLDCCVKLNHSSEFFETCSKAQRTLQVALHSSKGVTPNSLQKDEDSKKCVECVFLGSTNERESLESKSQKEVAEKKEKHAVKYGDSLDGQISDSEDCKDELEPECRQQRIRLEDRYTWQCTDCPTVLSTLLELKEHHNVFHNQAVRYQCIECAKVYTVYKKFTRHVRLHRNHDKYRCSECKKSFSSRQAMENHSVLHSGARPHSCSDCGKTFRQIGSLYSHRRVHQVDQKDFHCLDCGKTLLSRQSLEHHRKSHAGARDYTCDICGRSFSVKQGLAYHMMSHSGERPHSCQFCGKRCKTVYLLNKHVATHSDVKTHQCDVCGKQFRESSTLKLHTRIHTGVMPYRCEYCGRQFRFQGVYVIHRRQHTGERPYSCSDCKRDFTNWANYNKHIKCRHNEKLKSMDGSKDIHTSKQIQRSNSVLNSSAGSNAITTEFCDKSSVKTIVQQSQITFDDLSSTTRLDKIIGSLCPLQDCDKLNTLPTIPDNQCNVTDLYSQVHTNGIPGYYFSSTVSHDYSDVGIHH